MKQSDKIILNQKIEELNHVYLSIQNFVYDEKVRFNSFATRFPSTEHCKRFIERNKKINQFSNAVDVLFDAICDLEDIIHEY